MFYSCTQAVRADGCLRRGHRRLALCLLVLLTFVDLSVAETSTTGRVSITVNRLSRPPEISDFTGMKPPPDLARELTKVDGFVQWIPRDGEPASQKTEAYVGYDDDYFYAIYVCFDSEPEKIRARMSRREDITRDDRVDLFLDTFDDQLRAYAFTLNPLGIQLDAMWTERETGQYDASFDTIWKSDGRLTDQGYVAMMAIPFKSLRFPATRQLKWGIILTRFIPRANEGSFWPRVTSRIEGRLNQEATLEGLENVSPGRNIQAIPYGFFRSYRALSEQGEPTFVRESADFDAGVDLKMVFRDSLVLDVALNPDFNQVESDEPQVTVNQRFEVFFPEKRPFFLENASYFETPMNLLFTRRIADPEFGGRLTGKVGKTAIGLLLADDQAAGKAVPEDDPLSGKRTYYGVFRVNREIGRQSTVGVIFTNREFDESYNRVGGIDGRFKLSQNWVAAFQGVTSSTRDIDGVTSAGPAYDGSIQRTGRKLSYTFEYNDRSPGFQTLTGYLPGSTRTSRPGSPRIRRVPLRRDIRGVRQFLSYRFRPEGKTLIAFGPDVNVNPTWNHAGEPLDMLYSLDFNAELIGQTNLGLFYTGTVERLSPDDFDSLTERSRFSSGRNGFFWSSNYWQNVGIQGEFAQGTLVNLVPAAGRPPRLSDSTEGNLQLTFYPGRSVRVQGTYLLARVLERGSGQSVFNNHIARVKTNWQFSRPLSARLIVQYDAVLANQEFTELETRRNLNFDMLVTYQVNPWTAFYLGYNSNLRNRYLLAREADSILVPWSSLASDSWQLFFKVSYFLSF